MDMDIHGDARLAEGEAEDQVRAFLADAPEAHEHLTRVRDTAAERLDYLTSDFVDLPGFRGMEGRGVNQRVDLGRSEAEHRLGRARDREQRTGSDDGGVVPRARRK